MAILRQQMRDIVAVWLQGGMDLRGTNQTKLAKASGVSRDTISRILGKTANPKEGVLNQLAKTLRIPLPEFRTSEELTPAADQDHIARARDQANRILLSIRKDGDSEPDAQGLYRGGTVDYEIARHMIDEMFRAASETLTAKAERKRESGQRG